MVGEDFGGDDKMGKKEDRFNEINQIIGENIVIAFR